MRKLLEISLGGVIFFALFMSVVMAIPAYAGSTIRSDSFGNVLINRPNQPTVTCRTDSFGNIHCS